MPELLVFEDASGPFPANRRQSGRPITIYGMDSDGVASVRVLLFGTVRVDRNGTISELPSAAHRRIIGRLALSPEAVVSVRTLVDVLWPDDPPRTAMASLANQIHRLRGIVGADTIRTVPRGYLLGVQRDSIDAQRFQRLIGSTGPAAEVGNPVRSRIDLELLDEALALWTGAPLEEFTDEQWARPWIVRMTEQHAVAWERRIDALLKLGRVDDALADATAFCEAEPLRERSHMLLVQALGDQGRTADALRVFNRFRKRLADETGLEPSSAMVSMERELFGLIRASARIDPDVPAMPESLDSRATNHPVRSNLPTAATSFIGRTVEVASIGAAIRAHRLVTIFGPGGVGKTRLALEVAAMASWAVDGTWLVELDSVRDPTQVASTIATTIGLVATSGKSGAESVADWCSSNRALLVLDNCEHLLDSVASVLELVLASSPAVVVMTTSREPVRVAGEHVITIEPMPLPEGPQHDTDAVQLFVARARDESPEFDPTGERVAIMEICVHLDGLPLAIELAAARVRALSARSIADHLDQRFRMLTAGRRTAVERHRTLRAAIDWSYNLLDAPQRLLFERLSVFRGAFDLDDAVGVCASDDLDELAVLDLLAALVDRSLVAVKTVEPRYRLLETLRSYGTECLDAPEADRVQRAHAEWFRFKAERSRERSIGPDERRVRDLVLAQLPEYDAAAAWGFQHPEPAIGIDIAFFLFEPFWLTQMRPMLSMSAIAGWVQERRWSEVDFGYSTPLSLPANIRARCVCAAWLAGLEGDHLGARRIAEEITVLAPEEIWGHVLLAFSSSFLGSPIDLQALHRATLQAPNDPIRRTVGCNYYYNGLLRHNRIKEAQSGIVSYVAWTAQVGSKIAGAVALGLRGRSELDVDPLRALAHFEAGIQMAREAKSLSGTHTLQRVRISVLVDLAHPDALRSCCDALENSRDTGDRGDLASYLAFTATILHRVGDCQTVAHIAGSVDVSSLMVRDRRRYESTISEVRIELGPPFELLAAEAGSMDVRRLLDTVIAACTAAMTPH